jgi:hypothetical protein
VPAFEEVEIALDGHVGRRPKIAPVVHVEVAAADVGGDVIVAVTREAA